MGCESPGDKAAAEQCRCTPGGVICTGFTLVRMECSDGGFSTVELWDENQRERP